MISSRCNQGVTVEADTIENSSWSGHMYTVSHLAHTADLWRQAGTAPAPLCRTSRSSLHILVPVEQSQILEMHAYLLYTYTGNYVVVTCLPAHTTKVWWIQCFSEFLQHPVPRARTMPSNQSAEGFEFCSLIGSQGWHCCDWCCKNLEKRCLY